MGSFNIHFLVSSKEVDIIFLNSKKGILCFVSFLYFTYNCLDRKLCFPAYLALVPLAGIN